MRVESIERDFASWRAAARRLTGAHVSPDEIVWSDGTCDNDLGLLTGFDHSRDLEDISDSDGGAGVRVSKEFLPLAKLVSCHRDPARWGLLYRVLFRLTHGEPKLLGIPIDDDVHAAEGMAKAVRRDRHKMTAFVRFKKVVTPEGDRYIAWHRPDHYIVKLTAPFFRERFASLRWSILTPDDSVEWDGESLTFAPGMAADPMAGGDDVQHLWTTYYAHIFNPARIKLNAMRAEMPKKHWPTLPETKLIPDLLRDAPRRVEQMLKWAPAMTPIENDVPTTDSLAVLRVAARTCAATQSAAPDMQTVFGEGPDDARVVFIGEQPGDEEDKAGKPFIGPSGQLLDEVLEEIGIDRSQVYVTNAVKRFKYEQRGKRRIHAKPSARDMAAWKPWLMAELDLIKPPVVVTLGATAAQTLMGHAFRVTKERGVWFKSPASNLTLATIHPSAILRAPDPEMRAQSRQAFANDLKLVATEMQKPR